MKELRAGMQALVTPEWTGLKRVWPVHLAVILLTLCSVLSLTAMERSQRGRNFWQGLDAAWEFRQPAYSEQIIADNLFRTKSNTWSNLAYAVVGFYVLGFALHDVRLSGVQTQTVWSVLYGLACCFLAVGSGVFHASLSRWGQQLDVTAMYTPLLVLIGEATWRHIPRIGFPRQRSLSTWPLLAGLVFVTTLLLYHYKWSLSSGVILPLLILIVAGFALLDLWRDATRRRTVSLLTAIIALLLAVACRELDIQRRFGDAQTPLQGHAFWHLLTAVALMAVWTSDHCLPLSMDRSCDAGKE